MIQLDISKCAQKTKDYNFAAELYTEAYKETDPLLLFGIHEVIYVDSGKFAIKFLNYGFNERSSNFDICSVFFFLKDFNMMMSGADKELGVAWNFFSEFADIVRMTANEAQQLFDNYISFLINDE